MVPEAQLVPGCSLQSASQARECAANGSWDLKTGIASQSFAFKLEGAHRLVLAWRQLVRIFSGKFQALPRQKTLGFKGTPAYKAALGIEHHCHTLGQHRL